MTAQQIEKFIDAGYTKNEIDLLFKNPKVDPEPETKPEPKPEPETKPEPKPEPETKPEPKPEPEKDRTSDAIEALTAAVASLQETVTAMQKSNIKNASTDNNKKDTITDVMQSFIDQL